MGALTIRTSPPPGPDSGGLGTHSNAYGRQFEDLGDEDDAKE
jgi:hypothetical protein